MATPRQSIKMNRCRNDGLSGTCAESGSTDGQSNSLQARNEDKYVFQVCTVTEVNMTYQIISSLMDACLLCMRPAAWVSNAVVYNCLPAPNDVMDVIWA